MKKPLAIVLGTTSNMTFATGTMLIGLQRHISSYDYEVLILNAGLPGKEQDAKILESFYNCRLINFNPEMFQRIKLPEGFRLPYYYRFELFRLLSDYKTLIWLDSDIFIQGDIMPLAGYGPIAMGLNDSSYIADAKENHTFRRNFIEPYPEGYDLDADFCNSGVLVMQDSLPSPMRLYEWAIDALGKYHASLMHFDQSIFNMMAQKFPDLFSRFPEYQYNCYPLNKASVYAPIVHCFGAQKFWNNTMLGLAFPGWLRDYQLWQSLGGSAYEGQVLNSEMKGLSTYGLLHLMLDKLNQLTKSS